MDAGDRIIVGMNAYHDGNENQQVEILQIPHQVEIEQCDRLEAFKKSRNLDLVQRQLDALRADARNGANTMPALVEASDAGATMGEMVQALADVFGRYSGGPEW